MNRYLLNLVLFLTLSIHSVSLAQPGNCGNPGQDPCNPPAPVPITGIEWVIGSGILLGGGYLAKRRRKPEEE